MVLLVCMHVDLRRRNLDFDETLPFVIKFIYEGSIHSSSFEPIKQLLLYMDYGIFSHLDHVGSENQELAGHSLYLPTLELHSYSDSVTLTEYIISSFSYSVPSIYIFSCPLARLLISSI